MLFAKFTAYIHCNFVCIVCKSSPKPWMCAIQKHFEKRKYNFPLILWVHTIHKCTLYTQLYSILDPVKRSHEVEFFWMFVFFPECTTSSKSVCMERVLFHCSGVCRHQHSHEHAGQIKTNTLKKKNTVLSFFIISRLSF